MRSGPRDGAMLRRQAYEVVIASCQNGLDSSRRTAAPVLALSMLTNDLPELFPALRMTNFIERDLNGVP